METTLDAFSLEVGPVLFSICGITGHLPSCLVPTTTTFSLSQRNHLVMVLDKMHPVS